MAAPEHAPKLARAFLAQLRRDIGAAKLRLALRINRQRGDGTCATHDFCDANESMLEAFDSCFDRLPEFDGPRCEADSNLIDAAWTLATKPAPGCEIVLGDDE